MLQNSQASTNRSDIFTVSKLNRFAKHILEAEIGSIWISAEISNFVAASSGHWYFTLKDTRAQVKAAMFKGANRKVRIRPKEGDKVLVRGDISLYEARGDYQLIASHLEPDGTGDLKAQFEKLKSRLAAEGLFAQENKKALPERPNRIAVITSPTGAAIRDILSVFKRRNPGIEIVIFPSLVQGSDAAAQLNEAVTQANKLSNADAIIISRGGGSMEDMWCFNDEALARTIAQSDIPVVSAVGHEVDFTICDFVADLRAATPSAAAELMSYSNDQALEQILNLISRLKHSTAHHISRHQLNFQNLEQRLKQLHPKNQIIQQTQTMDQLQIRLSNAMDKKLISTSNRYEQLNRRLIAVQPQIVIEKYKQQLDEQQRRMQKGMLQYIESKNLALAQQCQLLDTLSPISTLSRGFSITFKGDKVINSGKGLREGDIITTKFVDSNVKSQVL